MNINNQENGLDGQAITVQQTILTCLYLLGIWIFTHPWEGIWHDSRLYALQALSHLRPDAYRNDLFFLYGSQDKYTLFSPVYAALISLLNLYTATIVLLLAGYILWVGSAALLLRRLLRGLPFWLGLTLIFSMPRDYSGFIGVFKYAESFLTPRLFSEGLTLLSLAMMLRGKWMASITAMIAAFVMHPLMAMAGASFVYIYLAFDRPKTILGSGVLGLVLLFSLALSNIAPFSHLFSTMDGQWYELTYTRSPFDFLDGWKLKDWLNRTLLSFCLLITATIAAQNSQRRAFLVSLIIGCICLLLTWIGTSLLHNLLLIQIQPWRVLWLTQFFSYIAAAWLVARFWNHGQSYRFLLIGFLIVTLTPGNAGTMLSLLVTFLFIWQVHTGKRIHLSQTSIMLLWLIPILAAASWAIISWLVVSAELVPSTARAANHIGFSVKWTKELLDNGGSGFIGLGLFLLVWRYGPDHRKLAHLGIVTGILLLLLLSALLWYRPIKQESYYEQKALQEPIPSFTQHIPVNAVVYWEDDPKMTWFALGRSNYASRLQTVGIVFSRQTAIEGKRRIDRLRALDLEDGIFSWKGYKSGLPHESLKGLVHVCHDPVLDFVVLSKNFGVGIIAQYSEKITGKYYYLYDCSYLRRNFDDTWGGQTQSTTGQSRLSDSQ